MHPAHPSPHPLTHIGHIPEVIATFRFHLSPPDLLSCVNVSRLWHNVFIAALWETIDDTLYGWPTILRNHDSDDAQGHRDADWINALFTKHGPFIRHLRLSWPVMIEAAYADNHCTRLLSLKILPRQITDRQSEEPQAHNPGHLEVHRPMHVRLSAITGPVISPIFDGILEPSIILKRSTAQQLRDWRTTQIYWLLALANTNLRTLRLDRTLSRLAFVDSDDFIYDSLAKLPHLEQVEIPDIYEPDLTRMLGQLPNLKCFYNHSYICTVTRTFTQIVWLSTFSTVKSLMFFTLLSRLPNLEFFRVYSMPCEKIDAAAIMKGVFSRLKILHIEIQVMKRVDSRFATRFLPWMPELVEFGSRMLWPETAKTLAKKNLNLKIFRQTQDGQSLHRYQRLKPKINVASILLELSLSLKTFNGIHHRITAQHLATHLWSCAGLEVFRCQIVGLPTLKKSDRTAIDTLSVIGSLSAEDTALSEDSQHSKVREKQQHWLDIHGLVYDRLASLIHLTVLDLGWESRDVWRLERTIVRRHDAWSEAPIHDSLELSLASGLKRLAPLTKLEVFGFDGVNHRIGKPELEWMARSWHRLKVMRGLHASTEPRLARLFSPRTALREYMQILRPDVVHAPALPLGPAEYEDRLQS
ncbi:hypothetical protein BGZ95_006417 [Linnemannia exigua]|uniref:F-box domain-containing protein n=1 Tax=Linnemannia exigua TaxID=604196 RepID=A0AAD4DMB6_9FUNG|nr:hypothetical protein BGZ95_006417 [Linnemannia exigua]